MSGLRMFRVSNRDGLPLKEGKYLKLSIQDHGSRHTRQNCFPRYSTPISQRNRKGAVWGLQPPIPSVKSHDGLITVESEAGVGTDFHIYLPASEKAMAGHKDSERSVVTGDGKDIAHGR